MKWLERLKSLESPGTHPREPREPGILGLQGYPRGGLQKFECASTPGASGTDTVVGAESLDSDCGCWPHSTAMNTAEIDRFIIRAAQFTIKGLTADDADALADTLLFRDRGGDDRRLCLECSHLRSLSGWWCENSSPAGFGRDLPESIPSTLQRCPGFMEEERMRSPCALDQEFPLSDL